MGHVPSQRLELTSSGGIVLRWHAFPPSHDRSS
jgi:hypothetical protein